MVVERTRRPNLVSSGCDTIDMYVQSDTDISQYHERREELGIDTCSHLLNVGDSRFSGNVIAGSVLLLKIIGVAWPVDLRKHGKADAPCGFSFHALCNQPPTLCPHVQMGSTLRQHYALYTSGHDRDSFIARTTSSTRPIDLLLALHFYLHIRFALHFPTYNSFVNTNQVTITRLSNHRNT